MSLQKMSSESLASINMKNIQAFAETFLSNPNKHVTWLADSGNGNRFCRTTFLLIVLQALLIPTEVLEKQVNLCQVCLPVLKNEWSHIQPKGDCTGDEVLPIYSTIACCTVRYLPNI
jgi:U3 small nucleolar RNA-associated protein 10